MLFTLSFSALRSLPSTSLELEELSVELEDLSLEL